MELKLDDIVRTRKVSSLKKKYQGKLAVVKGFSSYGISAKFNRMEGTVSIFNSHISKRIPK